MTLLSVVQSVCSVVGVEQPQSVFANIGTTRTMQEMLDLANEMAQRIAYDTRDWTKFRKVMTFIGDGVKNPDPPDGDGQIVGTEGFDLPANFKRLLLTSNMYRNTGGPTPMAYIPDTDEWMRRRANTVPGFPYGYPYGEWTKIADQIHFFPILMVGDTAFGAYVDKNCVALASGGFGDTFMADGDSFALDERLLKLGMTWQWKSQKGSPYSEDLATYSDALAQAMGHDSPAPIIIGNPSQHSPVIYGGTYANIRW